ncbi:MAG: hypothetical protein ACE5I5_11960 [Candidatus Heimdallarchaeota archaeon]
MIMTELFEKRLIIAVVVGGIIALLTGLLSNQPDLLGVNYWGYPRPWLKQVVYPGSFKVILWNYLILDWLIWAGIVFCVRYIIDYLLTSST